MNKVIILMGEVYYEGSHIIEVFGYSELKNIVNDVNVCNCFIDNENKWNEVLKEEFRLKYCTGFDEYYLAIRDMKNNI